MPNARYKPPYDAGIERWQGLWLPPVGTTQGVPVQSSFLGIGNNQMDTVFTAGLGVLRGDVVVDPSVCKTRLQHWHELGLIKI